MTLEQRVLLAFESAEQFEHLAELNQESTDASEIEERIKLMIRLANLF